MAKALRVTRVIPATVEVRGIALELDKDEAQALRDVLAQVGGEQRKSRRGLLDNILRALDTVGVCRSGVRDMRGTVYFEDNR